MASTVELHSFGVEIDADNDPIRYPDILGPDSAAIEIDSFEITDIINIKQYGNFFLMKEDSGTPGTWFGPHDIELNPDADQELAAVIGTDSELTPQELFDLADSNENVTLVWAEDCGVTIDSGDEETNLAKVLVNTVGGVKTIWTFNNIN